MTLQEVACGAVAYQPVTEPVLGEITVPGSKSITNRAMICAAMAEGDSCLHGVLDSEDTQVMVQAWQKLGLQIVWDKPNKQLTIKGCSGAPTIRNADLHIANSGTTIRFLTAALATTRGEFTLDGTSRMRERPIGDLIEGLRKLGADVSSTNKEHPNCPPVRILANGLNGGTTQVAGNVSSQFLSGMMMAAPYARSSIDIHVVGELVSKPYVDMTAAVMSSFGVQVTPRSSEDSPYHIDAPQRYQGCDYYIEPDASAASYFLAAAAVTAGRIRIHGLSFDALQGDIQFARVLEKMGCTIHCDGKNIELTGGKLRGIDIDMNSMSDTVQTLAAVAVFAEGPTRVRGVAHNRYKETDRIGDLARELNRLGIKTIEHEDGLTIVPGQMNAADIRTYRDHRMAMSLSIVGLRVPGVRILDPRCTEKTYPEYFEDLGRIIGQSPQYTSYVPND